MDGLRAWTEIDLDAFANNLQVVRKRAGAGVRVVLVVKQDAYGHGAVAIAHHALRCGVGAFGVGSASEALELRQAGIRLPILILGTALEEELPACLAHDVHVIVHSADRARLLQALASKAGVVARVHLNVDTGMGRLGPPPHRALEILREIDEASHLKLMGVMTHIASPEGMTDPASVLQIRQFEEFLAQAREAGVLRGWIHAANSACLFTGAGSLYDTVRPGIAAYGALPATISGSEELIPVLSLRTRVVFLKDIEAGTPVGYASTWRAPTRTRIATLPVGYGHGLPWCLEGWDVLIAGRRAPIVGRLSMDYITVDIGHLAGVQVGHVATVLGRDGEDQLLLEDMARQSRCIPYELTCALGRLARVYKGGEMIPLPQQAAVARLGDATGAVQKHSHGQAWMEARSGAESD